MKRFLFLLILVQFNYFECNAETFNQFNSKIISAGSNIKLLDEYYKDELDKYKSTKDCSYLYNSKYITFHKLSLQGKTNEAINLLSWVIEDGKSKNADQMAWFNYHLASNILFLNAQNLAVRYVMESINLSNKTKNIELLHLNYSLLGTINYRLKKYDSAIQNFWTAHDLFPLDDLFNRASMLNNISLCYLKLNNFIKSKEYTINSIALLKKIKARSNSINEFQIIVEGNLGSVQHQLGNLKESIHLLEKELNFYLNQKDHHYYSASTGPLIELLSIYQETKNKIGLEKVINKMQRIEKSMLKMNEYPLITEALYKYYISINDIDNALKYSKNLFQLMHKFSDLSTIRSERLNETIYRDRLNHFKREKSAQELLLEKTKNDKFIYQVLSIVSITTGILTILIITIFYINKRKILRKDFLIEEQNKQLEIQKNILLENDIKSQHEKITSLAMNLNVKKETEKAFLLKINELKKQKSINAESILMELQVSISNLLNIDRNLISNHLKSDDVLEKFKVDLKKIHPELTKTDVEYCCYFRMGLSAKEIGSIRNQSDGSVRVFKNKIKKKLQITPAISMIDYLNSFQA